MSDTNHLPSLADDPLIGALPIAINLGIANKKGEPDTKRIYDCATRQIIPTFKLGDLLAARKVRTEAASAVSYEAPDLTPGGLAMPDAARNKKARRPVRPAQFPNDFEKNGSE